MNNKQLVFENPVQQYDDLKFEINKNLSIKMADEIETFVFNKTAEKLSRIHNLIEKRYYALNELYEQKPKNKQQQQEIIKQFFRFVNPSEVIEDIKNAFQFPEIESDYQTFISIISKNELGYVFNKFKWDKKMYLYIQSGLLNEAEVVIKALQGHANQIQSHIDLLKSIKDGAGGEAVFKIGARILGHVVAGPLGSLAARGLTKAFMNHEKEIDDSFNRITEQWDAYTNTLQKFLIDLEERYKFVLLTIYGGTFIRVNQIFKQKGIEISKLYLGSFDYVLELTSKEEDRLRKWFEETTVGITFLLNQNHIDQAIKAADECFHFIKTNPFYSRYKIDGTKSLLYQANLYKVSTILKKAEQIKKHSKVQFVQFMSEFFRQQPLFIYEEDLKRVTSSDLFTIILECIAISIETGKRTFILDVFNYWTNLENRFKKQDASFAGEEKAGTDEFFMLSIVLAAYSKSEFGLTHEFIDKYHKDYVKPQMLRYLHDHYRKISNDSFTKYLKGGAIATTILLPVGILLRLLMKKQIWIPSVIILIICLFGFKYHERLQWDYLKYIFDGKQYKVAQNDKTIETFKTEVEAVSLAKNYRNSSVVDIKSQKLLWDDYSSEVFYYNKLLRTFNSKRTAIDYAAQYKHTRVVGTETKVVYWKNY